MPIKPSYEQMKHRHNRLFSYRLPAAGGSLAKALMTTAYLSPSEISYLLAVISRGSLKGAADIAIIGQ